MVEGVGTSPADAKARPATSPPARLTAPRGAGYRPAVPTPTAPSVARPRAARAVARAASRALLAVALTALAASPAQPSAPDAAPEAEPGPDSEAGPGPAPGATYEDQRLSRALAEAGLRRVADPAGRPVRAVRLIRRDVFVDDEIIPTFFNIFHGLTREEVVRRELLFAPGAPWEQARVDESMRNLRGLGIFTIVRIVAVEADDASPGDDEAGDPVDAVVFTRDLWSLRLETSFLLNDGFLDELRLTLIERNLLGLNKKAALRFELLPRSWSIGETYVDERLGGSAWALSQSFDLVFDRLEGGLEGSRGALSIGIPLRDLRTTWGFEAQLSYADVVGRQLSGSRLLAYDVPETPEVEEIPRVWDTASVSASVTGRYQTGEAVKHRVAFGFGVSDLALAPRAGELTATEAAAFRRDVLAPERRLLYPFVGWAGFVPEYTTFTDLASFGLTEDVRVGPWWSMSVAFPLEAFGSSIDNLVYDASVGAIATPGGALIDLELSVAGRVEQSRVVDQVYGARVRGATPTLPFGRVVASAHWEGRARDTSRRLVTLGGDNGLRGYPSQAFFGFGASRLRLNVEVRTPPLVIASAHLGLVAFWDGGAVWEAVSRFAFRQSAGLGVRLLFPQFNRFTFRLDLGVPLGGDGFSVLATFGSLQAVPLTAAEDAALSQ